MEAVKNIKEKKKQELSPREQLIRRRTKILHYHKKQVRKQKGYLRRTRHI
jgi:hypothetical protein